MGWRKWVSSWIHCKKPKLIIFYEDLLRDLASQLKKICDFLGVAKICVNRLNCTLKHSEGRFHRHHHTNQRNSASMFTVPSQETVNNTLKLINLRLKKSRLRPQR